MIDIANTDELFQLVKAAGHPHLREMGHEDRKYLAVARCALLDAWLLAQEGNDIHDLEIMNWVSVAADRIHWMLKDRVRDDYRPQRQLPIHIIGMLDAIGGRCRTLSRSIMGEVPR
jgi:hypothetical protein